MRKLLLPFVLLLSAAACRPLYLPPVPERVEAPERPVLDAGLTVEGGRPVLLLGIGDVPGEGWLAVQWFSPRNREAASESIWLDSDSAGLNLQVPLPADIEAEPGEWRALLSLHSRVLRQLDVNVP